MVYSLNILLIFLYHNPVAVAMKPYPKKLPIKKRIEERLKEYSDKFEVIQVPNITNICYGRGVGYEIEEIVLPKEIQEISATKIRQLEIS